MEHESWGSPSGSGKESSCNAKSADPIPGMGRSPEGGHGNPLQYSCLENPMDRRDWQAIVQRAAESDATEVTEHAHRSQKMSCAARCLLWK